MKSIFLPHLRELQQNYKCGLIISRKGAINCEECSLSVLAIVNVAKLNADISERQLGAHAVEAAISKQRLNN